MDASTYVPIPMSFSAARDPFTRLSAEPNSPVPSDEDITSEIRCSDATAREKVAIIQDKADIAPRVRKE
ncbi:hypothetical protein D3C75_973090 [compost metagenome]